MPAKSKSQQRLMGMVYAYKKGKLDTKDIDDGLLDKIKKIAKNIKTKDAKDFAETKHNNISENLIKTFESFKRSSDKHKEIADKIYNFLIKLLLPGKGMELRKNLNYYDIKYYYYQDYDDIRFEKKYIQFISIGYFKNDEFYHFKIGGNKELKLVYNKAPNLDKFLIEIFQKYSYDNKTTYDFSKEFYIKEDNIDMLLSEITIKKYNKFVDFNKNLNDFNL